MVNVCLDRRAGIFRERFVSIGVDLAVACEDKRPRKARFGVAQSWPSAPTRRTRADSKQAKLIEMLKRPDGATIDEIAATFGWGTHTVRGAIAGALKKKLGLNVASEKVEGRGRVYRLSTDEAMR